MVLHQPYLQNVLLDPVVHAITAVPPYVGLFWDKLASL